jgi:hypothetical protein
MFGGKSRRVRRGGSVATNAFIFGGKRRQQSKRQMKIRGRSSGIGGYWGAVLEQAIVPLTLLGIQQTYGRKRHLKGRTFKRRH